MVRQFLQEGSQGRLGSAVKEEGLAQMVPDKGENWLTKSFNVNDRVMSR